MSASCPTRPFILARLVAFGMIMSELILPGNCVGQSPQPFAAARDKLIRDEIVGAGVTYERVIQAILDTPRHEFLPAAVRKWAYYDMALPIGDQQTISSPFIVAYMTESLDPQGTDTVLEIGTGSGYQAAVLSPLVKEVFTIEIVAVLGRGLFNAMLALGIAFAPGLYRVIRAATLSKPR